jgi:protein SCO1/2
VLLAACSSPKPWHLTNVQHLLPDLQFSLDTDDGKAVTAADFRGDVVMLYFGYTHCPDVCPTTLAKLKAVLKRLGSAGTQARVLFVSVDPQRDTAATLQRYLQAFGPQFIGLRGSEAQIAALVKRYRVAYNREPVTAADHGNYAVSHSGGVFIFDAKGHARLLGGTDASIADYVDDLKRLGD